MPSRPWTVLPRFSTGCAVSRLSPAPEVHRLRIDSGPGQEADQAARPTGMAADGFPPSSS